MIKKLILLLKLFKKIKEKKKVNFHSFIQFENNLKLINSSKKKKIFLIAFDKEVEDMRSKVQKTPHDWEAKKDFNSAEYFEEDSRKGKRFIYYFFHNISISKYPSIFFLSRLKFLKHGSGRAPATG